MNIRELLNDLAKTSVSYELNPENLGSITLLGFITRIIYANMTNNEKSKFKNQVNTILINCFKAKENYKKNQKPSSYKIKYFNTKLKRLKES